MYTTYVIFIFMSLNPMILRPLSQRQRLGKIKVRTPSDDFRELVVAKKLPYTHYRGNPEVCGPQAAIGIRPDESKNLFVDEVLKINL